MVKFGFFLIFVSLVSGCIGNSPGAQCLTSFKDELKDPDSGKVISFEGNKLTYSATNSYGARIQGKALCSKFGGDKWTRDKTAEYIEILNLSTGKIQRSNTCRAAGKKAMECYGSDSLVMKHAAMSSANLDQEALNKESAIDLGYSY